MESKNKKKIPVRKPRAHKRSQLVGSSLMRPYARPHLRSLHAMSYCQRRARPVSEPNRVFAESVSSVRSFDRYVIANRCANRRANRTTVTVGMIARRICVYSVRAVSAALRRRTFELRSSHCGQTCISTRAHRVARGPVWRSSGGVHRVSNRTNGAPA